jgi:type II secretory pathway pseudopilin PulG
MESNVKVTPKNHKKKLVVIGIVILVLIITAFIVYQYTQKNKELQLKEQYSLELNSLVYDIISQSAEAESIINTHSKMWHKVIEETLTIQSISTLLDIQIDELIRLFNEYSLDFSKANGNVVTKGKIEGAIYVTNIYFEKEGKTDILVKGLDDVTNRIKALNNPPPEYEKASEIAFELYSLYDEYVSLAISPSGSLSSFNERTNQLSSDIIKKSKEFNSRMPLELDE